MKKWAGEVEDMDFLAEEMIDLKPAVVPGKKQITMEQKIAKIARFYLEKKKQIGRASCRERV